MASGVDFLGAYVRRVIDDEIDELFAQLPALLLDGPKGVGKTATATPRCRSVRRLDIASERKIVEADPAIIERDPAPLLIDEWHRVPAVSLPCSTPPYGCDRCAYPSVAHPNTQTTNRLTFKLS